MGGNIASMTNELCGSYGCTMPAGHNMGKTDIPENHGREGAVLRAFREANDQERAVILGRKIEKVQLSIRSADTALLKVRRQVDELLDYQAVLQQATVDEHEDLTVLCDALYAYVWAMRTSDRPAADRADRLAQMFEARRA